MKRQQKYTRNEISQALNQAVEEGKLHLIIKNGESYYVENTFNTGYRHALRDKGLEV